MAARKKRVAKSVWKGVDLRKAARAAAKACTQPALPAPAPDTKSAAGPTTRPTFAEKVQKNALYGVFGVPGGPCQKVAP